MQRVNSYELRRYLLSYIAPNRCPFCDRVIGGNEYFCGDCPEDLFFVKGSPTALENISRFYACCYYLGKVRRAMLSMKFSSLVYPVDAFAVMMSEKLGDDAKNYDVIVPVPSSENTLRARGFNPVLRIAKRVSYRCEIPVLQALKVSGEKVDQKLLNTAERYSNALNSFELVGDISGKRVLILDDVSTTGSTLSAIGEILRKAGAEDVGAIVFAKTCNGEKIKLLKKNYHLKNVLV